MITLLNELASFLATQGIGTVGTDIFIARIQPTPIDQVAIISTSGSNVVSNRGIKTPSVQIMVRGDKNSYNVTHTKAVSIFNILNDTWNVLATIKGRCTANALPGNNFRDDNDYVYFPLNFTFLITTTTL